MKFVTAPQKAQDGGAPGIIAGILVGGLGSRLAMRLSAIAAGPAAHGMVTENGTGQGTSLP